jgi:hypothetical protein
MRTYFDSRDFERLIGEVTGLDCLEVSGLVKWCRKECERAGVPFEEIYERRWNAAGEPIGPRMELEHDAAELVLSVAEAMGEARRVAFARKTANRVGTGDGDE